ncbi:hypothetical protein [sulfur-oxidizing endosymbiont of Gigantopelta aegis]|uniref:hypothetical protein n=1 Tax=sulfur-oxidizing endosymbiont of Gigantopelta aegis TaxID=2794934 RepID=UPI0018DEBAE9|nr:hypothetical protein [sulfur-oxidizing endosymbiont of Gigantopelta aegis]
MSLHAIASKKTAATTSANKLRVSNSQHLKQESNKHSNQGQAQSVSSILSRQKIPEKSKSEKNQIKQLSKQSQTLPQETSLDSFDQQVKKQADDNELNAQETKTDDVVVELPEQEPVVAEQITDIKKVNLDGSSDEALLSFTAASASSMAMSQPELGQSLDSKLNNEAKVESESVPALIARASGQESLAMVSPELVANDASFDPKYEANNDSADKLSVDEHTSSGQAPDNSDNKKLLDKQESSGFLDWFRNNFGRFMSRIKTSDSGLNTSAGERQKVLLQGNADLNRSQNVRSESNNSLIKQRDQSINLFRSHPGQGNIKAKAVNEEKKVAPKAESSVEVVQEKDSGMADYAEMPLPEDVRTKSDELLQASINNNLADARKQTQNAANVKETDKQQTITKAEADVQSLNQQADNEQKSIVIENRGVVAEQQRQGIKDASDTVKAFDKDAQGQQKTLSDLITHKAPPYFDNYTIIIL